ncbi:MAG: HAD family phosphatase [Merismopedia sp. SIO2A8]|nr:HAD family phosphatase [Merismopedia sp. SIO2A8]
MLTPTPALRLLPNCFRNARFIATDMDGTLTKRGKFSSRLLETLETLATAQWPVMIVTGRSAGWVNSVAHYLPIVGAIAENGGIFYEPGGASQLITSIPDLDLHREKLADTFGTIQTHYPRLMESDDNPFRLTDWTFDVGDLSPSDIDAIAQICQDEGWSFTYSTVQCHIKPIGQDKGTAVREAIARYFPQYQDQDPVLKNIQGTVQDALAQVVTVGDSPNDVSLFNPDLFPCSVGVANVEEYRDRLQYFPCHLTSAREVEGFCELAHALLNELIEGV